MGLSFVVIHIYTENGLYIDGLVQERRNSNALTHWYAKTSNSNTLLFQQPPASKGGAIINDYDRD